MGMEHVGTGCFASPKAKMSAAGASHKDKMPRKAQRHHSTRYVRVFCDARVECCKYGVSFHNAGNLQASCGSFPQGRLFALGIKAKKPGIRLPSEIDARCRDLIETPLAAPSAESLEPSPDKAAWARLRDHPLPYGTRREKTRPWKYAGGLRLRPFVCAADLLRSKSTISAISLLGR